MLFCTPEGRKDTRVVGVVRKDLVRELLSIAGVVHVPGKGRHRCEPGQIGSSSAELSRASPDPEFIRDALHLEPSRHEGNVIFHRRFISADSSTFLALRSGVYKQSPPEKAGSRDPSALIPSPLLLETVFATSLEATSHGERFPLFW